jgi:transcriptional regulator of acetoin/glycerol metabolism
LSTPDTVYQQARAAAPNSIIFQDTTLYAAKQDQPVTFIASPVHDHGEQLLGVLVFEVGSQKINQLTQLELNDKSSLEVLVSGPENLLRNDSQKSPTFTVRQALRSKNQPLDSVPLDQAVLTRNHRNRQALAFRCSIEHE